MCARAHLEGLQYFPQLLPQRYCLVSQAPIDLNRILEWQILNPSCIRLVYSARDHSIAQQILAGNEE